jgi:hypothetical protein
LGEFTVDGEDRGIESNRKIDNSVPPDALWHFLWVKFGGTEPINQTPSEELVNFL